jgi:predicted YcjX-like family ATPase
MEEIAVAEYEENPREIGKDDAWFANVKRTYDVYSQHAIKAFTDAQQFDNARQNIANQALQNAVETANMVGKQAVNHMAIAVDRQWNVDEQGYTVTEILRDNTFKDAIAGEVARAFATYGKVPPA